MLTHPVWANPTHSGMRKKRSPLCLFYYSDSPDERWSGPELTPQLNCCFIRFCPFLCWWWFRRRLRGSRLVAAVVLSLYLPRQKQSMWLCCRRSARINGGFQKAFVKNQCPSHAIDGCLATEERKQQRNTCLLWKNYPPRTVLF